MAPASGGGSDSNNGLTSGTPWLTPNHALTAPTVILAVAGNYDYNNFAQTFGICTSTNGDFCWLKCATFDTCKISVSVNNAFADAMLLDQSWWGVQGWEATATSTAGTCFAIYPYNGSSIDHVIISNNICNGAGQAGVTSSENGTAGVDYQAYLGNAIYNAASGTQNCTSGLNVYEPVAANSKPGTHIYIAGNFSWGNVDGNPCAGTAATDGNGIIFDTFDGTASGLPTAYVQQSVIDNNIVMFNGGRGVLVYHNYGNPNTVYVRHNTAYGNNTQVGQANLGACGEIETNLSYLTQDFLNIAQMVNSVGCNGDGTYAYFVNSANATDFVFNNWGWSPTGAYTNANASSGFSFGPGNTFTDPTLLNPVMPGAPSCGSASSVPNCMASVIADFAPMNAAAKAYGYQVPSSTSIYDPLYPQWLCSVTNLPIGLVTPGCVVAGSSTASGTGSIK
jgi:hypothetical protein